MTDAAAQHARPQPAARPGRRTLAGDVVVVGAGPAGIAVAGRLARPDRRVLVLESGGYDPAPDRDAGRGRVVGPVPYFDLAEARPRGLGGSTGLWGGWCEPLDEFDFCRPPLTPETGWCLSYSDIGPYYRDALAWCAVTPSWSSRQWRPAGQLDTPNLYGGRARLHARSFPVLGPRQMGHRQADLFDRGGVVLATQTTATRIVTTADGGAVSHLLTHDSAGEVIVEGDRFVLATGAIEAARMLLASPSRPWPRGLGNVHDLVGRCFMEHPHVDAARLSGDPGQLDLNYFTERPVGTTSDGASIAAAGALVLDEEVCQAEGVGRVQLFIEPAGRHFDHPLADSRNRQRHRPTIKGSTPPLALIAVTEQQPNRDSRVLLSADVDRHGVPLPIVQWELSGRDHQTLLTGVTAARELLATIGATNIRVRVRGRRWPADTMGGPHHMGTTRMARSPADGVVDSDCRVYGLANLFVAGSAVFPTSGYAPPTLTIIALSLRLADHLRGGGK